SAGYDPATNRQTGISYDANGNVTVINGESVTWNVENRISGWEYDAWGKRVGTQVATGGFTLPGNYAVRTQTWDYTLYSVTGQRLAVVECTTAPQSEADYNYTDRWGSCGTKQLEPGYFGSRPLKVVDRLGSVRRRWSVQTGWSGSAQSFYPYGEYKESGGTEGVEAFGTYQRDSMAATGVDYAMQRYYSPGVGRFYSPDPSTDGVDYENPLTWNAYSYVNGDPINFNDPSGLGPVTLPPIVPGVNCSTAFINYAGQFGVTIQQLFDSDTGILGVMSYFEQKGSGTSGDQSVWAALDWTFLNRWDLSASDKAWFYGPSNIPTSLAASVTTGNSRSQVFTSSGQLQAGFTTQLMNILTGSPDSSQCDGLAVAFDTAMGTIRAHDHDPIPGLGYFPNPVPGALQFASNGALPSVGRYVTQTVVATMTDRGNLWTFYGATYNPPPPVRRPPRRPPMPPGRPRRPL
ncbi:MAG: RHS repeat-associated core domain-containing protein, partial [Acidobacteriia bacterium]|nr:RHS repeat-associated core domain-containing protein [Terriglobia bacterium]